MKSSLLFDFVVNKEEKNIRVKREFEANLSLVWDAWTKAELLDKWWAPRPWTAKTNSMNFVVGGHWLYAMVSPAGEEHWCRLDYQQIDAQKSYTGLDGFCDAEGKLNLDFPRSLWNNSFAENGNKTSVDILIQYEQLEDLEKIIALGFQGGFTMGLGNLDELLEEMTK